MASLHERYEFFCHTRQVRLEVQAVVCNLLYVRIKADNHFQTLYTLEAFSSS